MKAPQWFILGAVGLVFLTLFSVFVSLPSFTRLQEIHVEDVLNCHTFEDLVFSGYNKTSTRLMLIVRPEWDEVEVKIVRERYAVLKRSGFLLGLHVHCNISDYDEQRGAIEYGIKFLSDLGINPEHFASGHWDYNLETLSILRRVGVKVFHVAPVEGVEDLTSVARLVGLEVVTVHNYIHDWELKD